MKIKNNDFKSAINEYYKYMEKLFLLNDLYKLNIKTSEAFFMSAEKPLWFRENQ